MKKGIITFDTPVGQFKSIPLTEEECGLVFGVIQNGAQYLEVPVADNKKMILPAGVVNATVATVEIVEVSEQKDLTSKP